MTEAQEDLAAELSLTGGRAWARLHGDLTSRLTVDVPFPGEDEPRTLPMAAVRGLATDPDAGVRRCRLRRRAGRVGHRRRCRWPPRSTRSRARPTSLNRRRGWDDSLDVALHNNNVDRATLAAMQEAVVASLADFARYLRAKATLLGHPSGALPWWDLLAPVGSRPALRVVRGHRRGAPTRSPPTRRGLAGLVGRAVDDALARRRAARRQGRRRLLHERSRAR